MKFVDVSGLSTGRFALARTGLAVGLLTLLAACTALRPTTPVPPANTEATSGRTHKATPSVMPAMTAAPAPTPASSRVTVSAEALLAQGVRTYQSGGYAQAESQLNAALKSGLKAPVDVAQAHKHLAFIYCTSRRESRCLAAFKAARAAYPAFALSKAEAGHPMWVRPYKQAMALKR